MQARNITTIFRKELKDTLRDRRTLIFMLLVPIVAIPLLITLVSSLMASQITKVQKEVSRVVIEEPAYLPDSLRQAFADADALDVLPKEDFEGKTLVDELKEGNIEIIIFVDEDFTGNLESENPSELRIYYDESELKSEFALDKVKNVLNEYKESVVQGRMEKREISSDVLTPFEISSNSVAPPEKVVGEKFGMFLPYIIIIMCFMGAMYPAIDLAAGEKERGTLETLLVSPATRGEFVVGKYLVILLTGVVAALLAMGSLVYSLNYMVGQMLEDLSTMLAIEFDIQTIALVLLTILPMAGIFAGVLLSVSIFARSFKEAQSYVTAMNMVIILPAFVSFLPGIEMDYTMALIPVMNASLIMKDAISGSVQWNFVL
ncbi:MAG: ABC transporter permease, partial [Candidatus Zixiibacteriota bacterium]